MRATAYMSSLWLNVIRIAAGELLADPEAVVDDIYRMRAAAAGPSTTQSND
jgi:very-short-patch-repair endonuclease